MTQAPHRQQMTDLCRRIPTVAHCAGVEPWDQVKFAKAQRGRSQSEQMAASFVLLVWTQDQQHPKWSKLPPFDLAYVAAACSGRFNQALPVAFELLPIQLGFQIGLAFVGIERLPAVLTKKSCHGSASPHVMPIFAHNAFLAPLALVPPFTLDLRIGRCARMLFGLLGGRSLGIVQRPF